MDHSTPNLPSRDFEATSRFYSRLGFEEVWRDVGWMVLERKGLTLEFFPHPDLVPSGSWFSCCRTCLEAGVTEAFEGDPRLQPPRREESGLTIGALIDPDGTLLRLIQN